MMIPNLPTDNLYKFCAITGLIIMGASLYFPIVPFTDVRKKRIEWQGAFDEAQRRMDNLTAAYNQRLKELSDAGKTVDSPESVAERDRFLKLSDNETKAIYALFREAEKADIDINNLKLLRYGAIGFFIPGLGIAIYGFWNWRLIQLLQDRILKAEAEKIG